MTTAYDTVVELRELDADEANALLREDNWKLLEIKTLSSRTYRERILTKKSGNVWKLGDTHEYQPVFDEREKIVYVVGRIEHSR